MLRKTHLYSALVLLLSVMNACSTGGPRPASGLQPTDEPSVAIAYIDGPRSGPVAGALVDAVDARQPRAGALLVAADTQYDPVTGQTSNNPISVYVTASDSESVESVELFHNDVSMGSYLREGDTQVFGNPFVFPAPRSALTSVPIPGAPVGLTASQLRAVTRNAAGQLSETAVLELQADGSRPDFEFSVEGNGARSTGQVLLSGRAFDPESGIASFSAFLNGAELEVDAATLASFSIAQDSLTPGPQSVRLVALNGVMVPNEAVYTFRVAEPPAETPTDPAPPTNPQPPTEPAPPTDPPTEPEPPADPTDPDNGAPTVSLTATPAEGAAPLTVTFTATATDPDDDELAYRWNFGDGKTASEGTEQTYTYAAAGRYTAFVVVRDGKGGRARAEIEITVGGDGAGGGEDDDDGGGGDDGNGDPSPDAPSEGQPVIAGDDAVTTREGETVTINVLTNDASLDFGPLRVVAVSEPVQGGAAEIRGDGAFVSYTPPEGFTGSDGFSYTVENETSDRAHARVVVKVEAR